MKNVFKKMKKKGNLLDVVEKMTKKKDKKRHMFKFNNRNTTRCEICSKLTIKAPFYSVSIVDFDQTNVTWVIPFI